MNDQTQDLARRAVACKHWRWMPGMQTQDFTRVCYDTGYSARGWDEWDNTCSECDGGIVTLTSACLPEFSDPATLGCLLALVREAWGSPMLNTVQERGIGWIVADSLCCSMLANSRYYRGQTEAEALVAALEAAP